MGEKTLIAWTDHTMNPAMGCTKVSDGCANCYAEELTSGRMGLKLWGPKGSRQVTKEPWRNAPRWNRAALESKQSARVFCASLCDVFEDHPTINGIRPRLWDLIRETPALDWQLLTKRPERIVDELPADWGEGWPNVWLGTSIEDERVAHRATELVRAPAVVHFVSYEPALGPLAHALPIDDIEWVIYGGESGPGFRPEDKQWAREMRQLCKVHGIAFFHKQSAGHRTELGIELDGKIVREYPMERRKLSKKGGLFQ